MEWELRESRKILKRLRLKMLDKVEKRISEQISLHLHAISIIWEKYGNAVDVTIGGIVTRKRQQQLWCAPPRIVRE